MSDPVEELREAYRRYQVAEKALVVADMADSYVQYGNERAAAGEARAAALWGILQALARMFPQSITDDDDGHIAARAQQKQQRGSK